MPRPNDVATRVKEAIADHGTSHAEFAALIGLEASKLSKSLNGQRRFSAAELGAIAAVAGTTVDWLLLGRSPLRGRLAARALEVESKRVDEVAFSLIELVAERWEALSALEELPPTARFPDVEADVEPVAQGTAMADAVLRHLGGPDHVILESTEALMEIVELHLGIDVAVLDLGLGWDGMSFRTHDCGLALIGTTARPGRQRFTFAHELGHLLFRDLEDEVVSPEAVFGSEAPEERRVNAFAAALLMPETFLRKRWGQSKNLEDLVWDLRVTPEALAWRLRNLGLVDAVERHQMAGVTEHAAALAGRHGHEWIDRIRSAQQQRVPRRLVVASLGAYLSGKTTLDGAADLLGVRVSELRGDTVPA